VSINKSSMNKFFDNLGGKEIITGMGWMPPLDISETDESIIIKVEVPGIEPKDIDISVRGDILMIRGEKMAEKEEKGRSYHFIERSCGYFSRSVALPAVVKPDQAKAEYKKGVLEIVLPKYEKPAAKKIPVKGM